MLISFFSPFKKWLFFVPVLFFQISLFGQSPGGISTNNTMWLRSDNGVTNSGNNVTIWQEASGANITGNFTVQPIAGTTNTQTSPTLIPAAINFNPYLSFDGITNSLSSINSFIGTQLVSNGNVTVFQVLNLKSGVVWLKWETDFNGTTGRLGFENSAGRLRFDFPKAVPASAGQNVGVTNILNKHTLSTAYANATTSVNRLNGADDRTIPIPGPGNFGGVSAKIVLGNEFLLNLPCRIELAEVIIYSNTLGTTERNKIESYLAVKYGFTLNQAASNNNNYVSTSGAITWDRTLNSAYANDITGIGRDDATALNQKQSISVNTTALVTLYNGAYPGGVFPLENSANTNTFSGNLSFLLAGDNGAETLIDQCTLGGTASRMKRIWKVSKTGTVPQVTIAVNQGSVPATVKNILVSPDPAFPKGNTLVYPVTLANGKLSGTVNMNHNDYFTLASDTIPTPQIQANAVCAGTASVMTIINAVSGATYRWYTTATGGTSVATGTSYSTVISANTTFFVEMTSPFGCLQTPRTPVLATIVNPVTLKTNDDTRICSGRSLIINTVSNATIFSWTPATGLSNTNIANPVASPVITTQYIITASANGCTAKDTLLITVDPSPQVSAGPDLTTISGTAVTLQGLANTPTILWTPNLYLSNNTVLNPVSTPVSSIVYRLTATGSNGCTATDSMLVNVLDQCIKPLNAFTPNNDGFNDTWFITNGNCIKKAIVAVYNRYGSKVYESQDYKNDWEGTYKNKPLPDGTYYYVIDYELLNSNRVYKKGNVTILR
jgi:gliding motility-associated-like protein